MERRLSYWHVPVMSTNRDAGWAGAAWSVPAAIVKGAASDPAARDRLPSGSTGKRHETDDLRTGPSAAPESPSAAGPWWQQLAVHWHSSGLGQQQYDSSSEWARA